MLDGIQTEELGNKMGQKKLKKLKAQFMEACQLEHLRELYNDTTCFICIL